MPRRLKIKTQEMGDLELYFIYKGLEGYEVTWGFLEGLPIVDLLSHVPIEDANHALAGWSWPLTSKLGIPPEGALRKLPSKKCFVRAKCLFHQAKICEATHPKLPWCFEVDGVEDDKARNGASYLIRMWREGVYIVVIHSEGTV